MYSTDAEGSSSYAQDLPAGRHRQVLSMEDFLHGPDGGVRKGEVVCSIHVPVPQQHDYFWSHKVGLTSNRVMG